MTTFHAVLLDETGCEFGADVTAADKGAAQDELRDMYPESRVVQLESPQDTAAREAAIYARVCADYDDFDPADGADWFYCDDCGEQNDANMDETCRSCGVYF